jgi:hypothetical protein
MYLASCFVVILRFISGKKKLIFFPHTILVPPWPLLNAGIQASSLQQVQNLISVLQN